MALLEINNISVNFGGIQALSGITFSVESGSIHSLIGPNGAGKTTLLNIISGIYPIQSGSIKIDQESIYPKIQARQILRWFLISLLSALLVAVCYDLQGIWKTAINNNYMLDQKFPIHKALMDASDYFLKTFTAYQLLTAIATFFLLFYALYKIQLSFIQAAFSVATRGIARSFQNIRLFPKLTCYQNILIALHNREGINPDLEVKKLLKLIRLEEQQNFTAGELSYGAQRRLEIARALATNPKLLLLDEPAAGMNPTEAMQLVELLKDIKLAGYTILLIEHNMKLIMKVSDRITVLNYGKLLAEGTCDQIRSNPHVIDAYLGKSENAQ